MVQNRYHDGWLSRWFKRMFDAGWRFWVWQNNEIMWRHADESVSLTISESRDIYLQFVNTGGQFIPTPYEIDHAN